MKTLQLTNVGNNTFGYYGTKQNENLDGFFDFLSAGSGAVASGAVTASTLITTGTAAATTVPVIGQIAGSVAILAGVIARSISKTKTGKATSAELKSQIAEIDKIIADSNAKKASIIAEINRLGLAGLAGLGSLKTFLQKTFTPTKYYSNEAEQLTAQLNTKIATAQALQAELEALQAKLTTGKAAGLPAVINKFLPADMNPTTKKIIVYGGGAAVIGTALYFLLKK